MKGSENRPNPQSQRNVAGNEGADESRNLHLFSDVDLSSQSQHHTIGSQPTQAAAGSHLHSGVYSLFSHAHVIDDISDYTPVDEVIVSATEPTLTEDDAGIVWIDSSVGDSRPEVVDGDWGSNTKAITSTTFAHPSNWATPLYTAPADGLLLVWAQTNIDATGLTNSRTANWGLRIYDITDALLNGNTVKDDRTRVYTQFNFTSYFVTEGETYKISYRYALSHANGTTFTVYDPMMQLMFIPGGSWKSLILTTV